MSEYGYLIIRDPGRETDIELGGLTGEVDESVESFADAEREARARAREGDQIFVLAAYDDTPALQLAAHPYPADAAICRCSQCGRRWPPHEVLFNGHIEQGAKGRRAGTVGAACPSCGGPCRKTAPRKRPVVRHKSSA